MKVLSVFLATAIFLTACGGGGDDETLHMRNFDISPENYQAVIRAQIAGNLIGWSVLCRQVDGLTGDGLVNFFVQLSSGSSATPTVPQGGTPVPGQAPTDAAKMKAAKIIQTECARTF